MHDAVFVLLSIVGYWLAIQIAGLWGFALAFYYLAERNRMAIIMRCIVVPPIVRRQ